MVNGAVFLETIFLPEDARVSDADPYELGSCRERTY